MKRPSITARILPAFVIAGLLSACATKPQAVLPAKISVAEVVYSASDNSKFSAPDARAAARQAGYVYEAVVGSDTPTRDETQKIRATTDRNLKFSQHHETPEGRSRMLELFAERLEAQLVQSGTAGPAAAETTVSSYLIENRKPTSRYEIAPGGIEGKLVITIDRLVFGNPGAELSDSGAAKLGTLALKAFAGRPSSTLAGSFVLTDVATGVPLKQGAVIAKVSGKIDEAAHLPVLAEQILENIAKK